MKLKTSENVTSWLKYPSRSKYLYAFNALGCFQTDVKMSIKIKFKKHNFESNFGFEN